jgi:predicted transcriptional regulator
VPDEVPAEVVQILRDIEGFEHLETLVLMRRDPRPWTPAAVAGALNIDDASAAQALEDLARIGLVQAAQSEHGPTYRFLQRDAASARTAEQLIVQYDTNRIAIMQLMNANAIGRVRGGAVRAFADSFVLGKKKRDG